MSSETVTNSYDARGRVVKVSRSGTVNNGVAACYAYDKADNRANVTVALSGGCSPPSVPTFIVSDVTATEGGSLTFTVTRIGAAAGTLSLSFATADGTAVAGTDYSANSGSLSFAPVESSKTVTVTTTNDTQIESPETLYLNLSNVSAGGVIGDNQGLGTINDDEGFSVSDASKDEAGGQLRVTVTKTGSNSSNITLGFATADGTALAGTDYSPKLGMLTFTPTTASVDVNLTTLHDAVIEPNETILVSIFNASTGTILDGQGVATIIDNDTPPSFSVNDATIMEGGNALFTITKTGLTQNSYNISFSTSSGTAIAETDYSTVGTTLTFASNETTKTWYVPTLQDSLDENNEQFNFNIHGATGGATISRATGIGTITDDEPSFAISDGLGTEGGTVVFTVTKTGPGAGNINYVTANGTALSGSDYTAASATLSFASGEASKQVVISTINDSVQEIDETFAISLSGATNGIITDANGAGTIRDNDGGTECSGVSFSITNNPAVEEGNPLNFTVVKSGSSSSSCTVNYATANGTANATDYTATSGTLTYTPAQTTKTVTVVTSSAGGLNEQTEVMYLNLSSPSGGAAIGDGQGVGTLYNYDAGGGGCPLC